MEGIRGNSVERVWVYMYVVRGRSWTTSVTVSYGDTVTKGKGYGCTCM